MMIPPINPINNKGKYEGKEEVPDSFTPFVGIRAWRVQQTPRKETRLFSVYKTGINWPIGRRLKAQCIQPSSVWARQQGWPLKAAMLGQKVDDPVTELPIHKAPFKECTCGIYALNSRTGIHEVNPWTGDAVLGVVLLWGHVLEGDRGYRAQYAKLVALWIDDVENLERVDLIVQLAEMYKVPTIVDLDGEIEKQRKLQGG